MNPSQRASLLVLNYNGLRLLDGCFGTLAPATSEGARHDVYLIDNGSSDDSVDYTQRRFPWVKCVRAPRNAYLFTYNDIVPKLDTEPVLLLNNDILVEPDFIEPLLEGLAEDDVFAVNSRVLEARTGAAQGARTAGGYYRGLWWYNQLPDIQHRSTCFFALGGQAVFSRSKYLEIGGFDELFWPLYHEDIDLSYRAWRRGWRVLYEPRSVIHHLGAQTSSKEYKSDEIRTVVTQNMFLFQWKNIDDPAMRAAHWAWLPLRLARAAVMGDVPFLQGFGRAWARRKYAALARAEQAGQRRVGDAEAFSRMMAEIEGLSSGVPQAARREVTQSC